MKYNEVIETLDYIYSLDESFRDILAIAGGIVPYLVTDTISKRNHGDIDIICNIKDMNKVRELLKKNNLYNGSKDSLLLFDKDYGFETTINNLKVGFYPYEFKDKLFQFSYDSKNKKCKIRELNINLDEYIKNYSTYKTMSLEVILKSKIVYLYCREKDKDDIDTICKYGFDNELYSRIMINDIK